TAGGHAVFDFSPDEGTEFQFKAAITNANLRWLMADLATHTNRLEGVLNGNLVVTSANTRHWESWQGNGHVSLRDGLIWEIPIFGILSPALDSIVPGLGNSRLSEGSASFTITNSIIESDNLELRSPVMRLQYRGRVDFQGNVNAQVEAELLRDMWVVGRAVSTVLWPVSKLFEYQITGTLAVPKTDPVYVLPRLLSIPLHPFRTLKELLPPIPGLNSSNSTSTNAPPGQP
ncbi:MAG TPA: AsmA-like C-terminal region-containing protein, partial [Verrucomicrobiae bacterium]|nr:AsmA-like C-terminal region-containing protein [Verrucomicrobiae bacterium]